MNTLKLNSAGLNRVTLNTIGEVRFKSMGGEPKPPSYENGVYIQHIDGKLYTTDEWTANAFANADANGVAVIADEARFVVSAKDKPHCVYGGYQVALQGVAMATTDSEAFLDYNGRNNTENIIAQLSGYKDPYGTTGSPAAESCKSYIFPNGQTGYLPATGELAKVRQNNDAINGAMLLIGGDSFIDEYWSSTQCTEIFAWSYIFGGYPQKRSKGGLPLRFRPFTELK